MLKRSVPILAVRDVQAAVAFYTDVLGFTGEWFWGDPVSFGGAACGDISVMFNLQPELAAHVEGHQHYFWSDELESLHAQHANRGAPIVSPIGNKPWGLREYTVRDPNGYHLRFSGPKRFEKPPTASAALPDFVRIETKLPTDDEYRALHKSVGWNVPDVVTPPLDRNLFCVVAIDTRDTQPVGMLRVMQDAAAWFSIWDVIVRPEFQSQRVGEHMMKTALARLREIRPAGGHAHLFTFSERFYEKAGFAKDACMKIAF